jgi:tetratricopeptide (TPR) repeat protein
LKIFISYRRADAADTAGRIFDRLKAAFGDNSVFKDVDSILVGADFEEVIAERIADCDAVLVIIGPRWATESLGNGPPRLHDPADLVRKEIEQALQRQVPVVPALVGFAEMPKPSELPESIRKVTRRNAISIRPDPDFHRDMDRLIQALQARQGPKAIGPGPTLEKGAESSQRSPGIAIHPAEPASGAVEATPPRDPEIQRLNLAAQYYLNKRTEEAHRKSIATYVQVLDKDPSSAWAWADLAAAYHLLGVRGYASPTNACPKAKSAALRAIALDNSLGKAHSILASIMLEYDWDLAGAEQAFQCALQLTPKHAGTHQSYGKCLACLGRHAEAIAALRHAQELDPLSAVLSASLGRHGFFLARMYDEAARQFQKLLETDPNFWFVHRYLAWAYLFLGRIPEAVAEFVTARQLYDDSATITDLGHAYAVSGQPAKAQECLDALSELSRQHYISPDCQAIVFIGLGDREQAFSWLEKAVADRSEWLCRIRVDPVLDPLRSDSRFEALIQRMNIGAASVP